jgi:glycosyltransferase involved in cell wall biosynthesis
VLARRAGADLVHSLASVAPMRLPGVAHVVTVHDVTFFKHRTFNPVTTFGMRQVVSRAARHADGLIAVTAAARDEICEELGLSRRDFAVVPHGAERRDGAKPAPAAEVRARYGLGGRRVVLCVSAKRPHKNQAVLVRAAEMLEPDVVVVLAGPPEPYDRELRALANAIGVEDRVRFTDYVPDSDLETLWELASCAAFPSRAEGFGMPMLDALRRAVPVVASDLPVFREIADAVPRWFDPDAPDQAAAAIRDALGAGAADAARLERGRERAAGYTWPAAAAGTWGAYERALERYGRRCASR